jgi:hypothetical protein
MNFTIEQTIVVAMAFCMAISIINLSILIGIISYFRQVSAKLDLWTKLARQHALAKRNKRL